MRAIAICAMAGVMMSCQDSVNGCYTTTSSLNGRVLVVCPAPDMAKVEEPPPPPPDMKPADRAPAGPEHVWSRSYPANPYALAVGRDGNTVLTGPCTPDADFGNGKICTGPSIDYVYLNKIDQEGRRVWSTAYT